MRKGWNLHRCEAGPKPADSHLAQSKEADQECANWWVPLKHPEAHRLHRLHARVLHWFASTHPLHCPRRLCASPIANKLFSRAIMMSLPPSQMQYAETFDGRSYCRAELAVHRLTRASATVCLCDLSMQTVHRSCIFHHHSGAGGKSNLESPTSDVVIFVISLRQFEQFRPPDLQAAELAEEFARNASDPWQRHLQFRKPAIFLGKSSAIC